MNAKEAKKITKKGVRLDTNRILGLIKNAAELKESKIEIKDSYRIRLATILERPSTTKVGFFDKIDKPAKDFINMYGLNQRELKWEPEIVEIVALEEQYNIYDLDAVMDDLKNLGYKVSFTTEHKIDSLKALDCQYGHHGLFKIIASFKYSYKNTETRIRIRKLTISWE